jgi:hypothetical protein
MRQGDRASARLLAHTFTRSSGVGPRRARAAASVPLMPAGVSRRTGPPRRRRALKAVPFAGARTLAGHERLPSRARELLALDPQLALDQVEPLHLARLVEDLRASRR